MSEFNNEFLLKQLNWRYAAKKFDANKKISMQDWETLEETLRLSPSSYGLQPWKFLVIENTEIRKKLTAASYGQMQVQDCSHFVVLTTLKKLDENFVDRYMKSIADTRGVAVSTLEGFKKNIVNTWVHGPKKTELLHWTRRQVYIAMGSFMTAAALMNVDTAPMEGLDSEKFDEILNLKDSDFATVAAIACGYRSSEDPLLKVKKVRFNKKEVIEII